MAIQWSNSRNLYAAMLLIAFVQGCTLLFLHQAIEFEFWPHDAPHWLYSFYAIAVVAPVMLLLGLNEDSWKRLAIWTACFSLITFCLGYYTGLQVLPVDHPRFDSFFDPLKFHYITTLTVATLMSLMYIQILAAGETPVYSRLFQLSWRNFLTLALSLLFTLCFWFVLMLWAELFKAIKINFFYFLFREPWFYYPALALANSCGVIIFRQQSQVIDTITRIQQALMKYLLIILVFVSIIFLAALLFTGLDVLWASGGSLLILWMQALMLFFVNAVYQDDPEVQPYPLWIHRFIYLGLALLPIYSLISFYGLSLRVEQYGWTVSRGWAFLLWACFALFAIGYLWGIAKRRDEWLHQLSWVNVRMGLVVLALMLIVNSPLLDFRKISANSQMSRLEKGEVSLQEFDYRYFRQRLARPGYDALQRIKEQVAETNPEIPVRINSLYAGTMENETGSSQVEFMSSVNMINGDPPEDVAAAIFNFVEETGWRDENIGHHLVSIDANVDGETDYLFVEEKEWGLSLNLFHKKGDQWEKSVVVRAGHNPVQPKTIFDALQKGEFSLREHSWRLLEIGGYSYRVYEEK